MGEAALGGMAVYLALDHLVLPRRGLDELLDAAQTAGYAGLTLPSGLLAEPAARSRGGRLAAQLADRGLRLAAVEVVLPADGGDGWKAGAAGVLPLVRALAAFGVGGGLVLVRPAAAVPTGALAALAAAVAAAQLKLVLAAQDMAPAAAREFAQAAGPGVGLAATPEAWLGVDLAPLAGVPLLAWAPSADAGEAPALGWLRALHALGYDGALVVGGAGPEPGTADRAPAQALLETARRRGFAR